MNAKVTRRDFLAGSAAALGAAVPVAALASESLVNHTESPASIASESDIDVDVDSLAAPSETYDCDFCVCGSGTAGLSAACRAAELGADVIVVDVVTENGVGGNSRYVENLGKMSDGADAYYQGLVEYHRYASNARVTRRFANSVDEVTSWTCDTLGTILNEKNKYQPNGDAESGGLQAIMDLYNFALEHGVRFLFDARAVSLLTDDSGAVNGVLTVSRTDEVTQVNAKAVDLCTGGFAENREMFEYYTHVSYDRVIARGSMGTERGDGLKMGLALGAQLHHPTAINYCSPILPGHYNKGALTICGVNQADTVFLNESGRRFCPESVIKDWTLSGNIGCQQGHIFVVVDQDYVDKVMTEGIVTRRANYFEVGEAVPQFQEEIDAALTRENPRVVKADTLEELAGLLGLDPEAVTSEIERFNGFVDEGVDEDFMKEAEYLRKVQTAPFYGFRTQLAFYNTVGGLKVDEYARVIDEGFQPIPGLYAGGSDAGGLFGPYYDVSIAPGSTQLWGRVSGYWAAEHAVGEYIPTLA